ncbi:hypothetical protein BEP19_13405 [Ammoniphilus oxalaticus]|uniref:DUF4190 domain-containing protein n=1 Tax=Ammoniphilus oxalaticus TaxID=66863 RepID=A0A419SF72_9BACL|nr:hypothetical protein [Ammoniphilus oxalaticus]RKD22065.1 hypothetical protein BEP19_13405 [Ammoniphilus oxalaticus]
MEDVKRREDVRDRSAIWMAWLGILSGVISLFYAPFLFGGVALILGIITAFSKGYRLGWWALALGIVSPFLNIIFHGIRVW